MIYVFLACAVTLVQCREDELGVPQTTSQIAEPTTQTQTTSQARTAANTLFVSTTGNDAGDGSVSNPWKTIQYAVTKVPPSQGYTILLSAGTFIENGLIEVPLGVSIEGAGTSQTIIKAISSFYYHPASPSYATDKFLISLTAASQISGNQILSKFTIDGDAKQLHGGVYVKNRSNVTITDVKVQDTNFTGIWLWDVKDSKIINTQLVNCSWGSASYCAGALNLGNVNHLEINNLNVDENTGYGIKAIGPSGNNNIVNLRIHDSRISVHPLGLWNSGTAPNIAIELWQVNLVKSEIYNTYVDNTISLINSNATPSTGVQTIRVHHNTIDLDTRAHGAGYGIELTVHDAEVDHNYFIKGNYGIANWDNPMKNWSIHHNTFYAMQGTWPGEVVRSQWSGLHNVKLYNNTIEFAGTKTMNVVGLYGGVSDNVDVKNNLFMDNNTGYSFYPNQFVHMENGATLSVLTVTNNSFTRLPIGSVPGTYLNNLTNDPQINSAGVRADPYYALKSASPLINAGIDVGYPYAGSAPDIGAFESQITTIASAVTPPVNTGVSLNLDSSDATLSGMVTTGYDAVAQNGTYFYVAPGSGKNYYIPPPGAATFKFQLPKTDNYVIWAKIISPTLDNQG
ncbi:MAG TPA: right-handed parallel beta-helix repeat-containing protein, partial [Cyclobacteriaceae bacterium]|nr:right-handed parallel beta-helix repeat-containing protein [Cyclobacteriaceae bacterium]